MTPDPEIRVGRLLADPKDVKARARRIVDEKGLRPDEVVLLAGNFLFDIGQAFVMAAYGEWSNGQREYNRDFARVVRAVKDTGITPGRGNGLVLAWALKLLQDAELAAAPTGAKP